MSDKERIAGHYRCPVTGRLRAATPEEMQQLFDEIERLRNPYDPDEYALELEKEIERLREALREIVEARNRGTGLYTAISRFQHLVEADDD